MRNSTLYFFLIVALCGGLVSTPACAQNAPPQQRKVDSVQMPESGANAGTSPAAEMAATPEKFSAAYFYNRANYAISREMYAEALEEINKGMDLDPAFLPFIMQKALVLSRLARHDDAARFYALALEAKPDDARLAALAVENLQNRRKNDAAGLSADLVRFFSGISVEVTPELLKLLPKGRSRTARFFCPHCVLQVPQANFRTKIRRCSRPV